jgi:cbb3-type cytochrome oxidase subunit 1
MSWNVFERNRTCHPRRVIVATTKAAAEMAAFLIYHRAMDVDLARGDNNASLESVQ